MDQMLEDMYTTQQYSDPCQDGKLRIMQLNASGIQGKCDEILEIILSQQIAVTFISETWLRRGQVPHPCISHCYSGSLPNKVMNHQPHGLAIMIHPFYLNKHLKDVVEIIQITEDPNPVHGPCFILCRLLNKFVTLFVYLSPTWSTDQCISTLIPILHEDSRLPRPDILLGDFNMRLGVLTGDTLHNQRGQVLNDATSSHGYSLIPYTVLGAPTFVSSTGESIVDLFYGTAEIMTRCTECTVLASSDVGSDHVPCVLTLVSGTATPNHMPIKTKYRIKNLEKKDIREEYQKCFTEKLRCLHACFSTHISDWSLANAPVYQQDLPDDVASPNTFITNIVEDMNAKLTVSILDTCRVALGIMRVKKKSAKNWFLDQRLRDMIYDRRDYYKKWKATDDPVRKSNMRMKYVQQKALVQKECQTKKRLLFDEWAVKLDTMKKSEMTKVLSGMLRKRSGKSVSALDTSDTKMTEYTAYFATLYTNQLLSPEEKSSLLGNIRLLHQDTTPLLHQSRLTRYLSSSASTCRLQDSLLTLQNVLRTESLDVISLFSDTSISEIIMYLPNAKAPGASLITAEMLKPIRADVSVLLALLFTLCYITGYIPLQWRQAILCPILKKGNPSDIENYRPISLTETFRKIYEKALLPAFQCFIEPLSIYQNGFRCYRSTVDHVAALQYISQTTKGKHGKSLVYAFLDIKAAYDKVNRSRLWAKFRTKSMPERLVSSARSLFDSTTSRVAINNTLGGSFDNYSGLLQGSILSPIFYAFFIDDLPKLLKDQGPCVRINNTATSLNCLLYADDIVLISKDVPDMKKLLSLCEKHAIENDYRFNSRKCEVLHHPRYDPPEVLHEMYQLMLHGQPLTLSVRFKYLGVYFNTKGIDITAQIIESTHKAKTQANLLTTVGANGYGYSTETNVHIYKSFVRPILEYCLCVLPLGKKHLILLERAQSYCLDRLLSVSKNTSNVAVKLLCGLPSIEHRRNELSASWYLKTTNMKGEYVITDCLRHDLWYTRQYGRRRKKVPMYATYNNPVIEAYNREYQSLIPVQQIMDIQVLSPLSPPIETYNRFQHLEIEDVFEETVLYQDVLPTETASDCRYMSVKVACNDTTRDLGEKIRSATQVNWYDHSLLKRVKRDLRQEDARKLITVHRLTRSVTTVAKTAPTGTSVVELLKTTLIRDKRIKRIFVLWLLQKFNKHDMKCLKCQSGAPATMPHMLACCKIQDVIQSINRRYIKCIEDMLHPRNNRVSSKCYQIACSLIYRMLRQCQGINLDYRPTAFLNPVKSKEITSKVPLNATSNVPLNVTSNVQLNATPNVPLNATSNVSTSDTSIVLVNATSDVSVIDTLNVHINDTLPLGSIEVSDNDTPTSFFKSRSMLLPLSDKTVPRKKGSNYCLHSRTISSIIQMPKTLSLSKRINSKSTKTPSPTRKTFKNPRTKHAAQINGQVSTAATSSVAHYATLALPVPTACSVSAPATSPLAAVTSEVSDEDTQIHAWDTSSVTDEDTLMSNTSTSNYETAEIRQERFRRFKKIADDELAKPNPMVNVEVLNDERLLKYLAGISFNTAENFTSRYLPILKCNSCRNHTLHKYNKIENICQRIRCSVCTTSIPNYFFFPLCYHVHQLLENLDFNVAYAVELDALDCIPDKSLLGPNNIVLERPTKKITEKASHILIMEELKQVKKELDLIKSTTSRIASVSCTDTPTLNDVADTATLSLPINDSSIMSSIDVAPRPMRNSPWDDIPPAKKQRH